MIADPDRAAVYAAEDQWTAVVDRGGTVDFFGSMLTVPVQRRFGDLSAVREYVEWVCASVGLAPPEVRARRGHTRAHYESDSLTIAIPGMDTSLAGAWAARESVVLHEIAHHWSYVTHSSLSHGVTFRSAMVELTASTLGDEAALILRAGYDGAVRD